MRLKILLFGGGMTIVENEKKIPIEYAVTTKMIQLWISILMAGEKGISRKKLLERLYGGKGYEEAGNSLRVNLYRLRRYLTTLGCFGETDCILNQSGRFYWNREEAPVLLDTEEFQNHVRSALEEEDEDKKMQRLLLACEDYAGDFLPELASEEWAAVEAARFSAEYQNCMQTVGNYLMREKQYEKLIQVCEKASHIDSEEYIYLLWIDSLLALHRYQEGMKIYEKAAIYYLQELGLPPSQELLLRFGQLNERLEYQSFTKEDIRQKLRTVQDTTGAYYCAYPGFIDSFHTVWRMLERSGQTAFLMLCTVCQKDGKILADKEKQASYMESLKQAIGTSLRKSDIYTQFGENQYLILLVGMKLENRPVIQSRIQKSFEENAGKGKVLLVYRVFPVLEE